MKEERFDKRPEVVDLIMFDGNSHRVLFVPVNDGGFMEPGHYKFIDIKNGGILNIAEKDISMKMSICRFDDNLNIHPGAKSLIKLYMPK